MPHLFKFVLQKKVSKRNYKDELLDPELAYVQSFLLY